MVNGKFSYNKNKVIQALRYHFISRPEIKIMIVLVNVFAIVAAALFFFKKINPMAFLSSSALWFILMLSFWFFLPYSIYRTNKTFKDEFGVGLSDQFFTLATEKGSRQWEWNNFSHFIETPFFFHLYFSARSFFLVPKDAFTDTEENEARSILQNNLEKKKS